MSAVVPQPTRANLVIQPRPPLAMTFIKRDVWPDVADVPSATAATAARLQLPPEKVPATTRDGNSRSGERKTGDNWRLAIRLLMSVAAIGIVIGLWQVFYQTWGDSLMTQRDYRRPVTKPLEGLTIFAVFFVGALALEQLLSPLTRALIPSSAITTWVANRNSDWVKAHAFAQQSAEDWADAASAAHEAKESGAPESEQKAAQETAETKLTSTNEATQDADTKGDLVAAAFDTLSLVNVGRLLILWATSTSVAMLAVVFTHVYFLRQVGIDSSLAVDVLATGLIIGAGTAPLSGLVSRISAPPKADA